MDPRLPHQPLRAAPVSSLQLDAAVALNDEPGMRGLAALVASYAMRCSSRRIEGWASRCCSSVSRTTYICRGHRSAAWLAGAAVVLAEEQANFKDIHAREVPRGGSPYRQSARRESGDGRAHQTARSWRTCPAAGISLGGEEFGEVAAVGDLITSGLLGGRCGQTPDGGQMKGAAGRIDGGISGLFGGGRGGHEFAFGVGIRAS